MQRGDRYGCHRVIEPRGVLPQAAARLDNNFDRLFDGEMLVDAERLNIDAASFVQMEQAHGADGVARAILDTVAARGKQHNPATGSGGMFVGRVARLAGARADVVVGQQIASLASLSLTPLRIDEILAVDARTHQVSIRGQALLFESSPFAILPEDLPLPVALAVLDVCGAPAQIALLSGLLEADATLLILGAGGKSGLLVAAAARAFGSEALTVIGIDKTPAACAAAHKLGAFDNVITGDATDALAVMRAVEAATNDRLADLTVVCTTVPECELGAILATRDGGTALFFSMATNFQRATLGAEGVGKDVTLLMGNGFVPGHAALALDLVRRNPALSAILSERFML